MIKHVVTNDNISFVVDDKIYTYHNTHREYKDIYGHVMGGEIDDLRVLVRKHSVNLKFFGGRVYSKGGILYIKYKDHDASVDDRMHTRIFQLLQDKSVDKKTIRGLLLFIDKLYQNPNAESIDDLFRFLGHNSLPITDDGCFIAYKLVNDNYTDIRTGTMSNAVGDIVEMPRAAVQFDREVTCSSGLHFCSRGYLPHYGGSDSRIMILKINPADVVSIPTDYHNAKGRACKYEVIGEIPNGRPEQREEAIKEVESKGVTILGNLLTKLKSFFTE